MAKIIKITPEIKQECRIEFQKALEKALSESRMTDGKLSFSTTLGQVQRKAKVYISEIAWMKMSTLLREFSKEVAWHATAFRVPGDNDEYYIKDILVYPQTVTNTNVEMDTEKYAMWLMENIEDERFNDIRCQMHSHVYMQVNPSSVDMAHQEAILDQLGDEDFYIFMIWNKRFEMSARIYDLQKNILFESSDVSWQVVEGELGLSTFIEEAKKLVVDKPFNNNYGAQGYGRSPTYTHQNTGGPYNPVNQQGGNTGSAGKFVKNESVKCGESKKDKKKDKKKTKMNTTWAGANACDDRQLSIVTPDGEEVDMSDPFFFHDGPFQYT